MDSSTSWRRQQVPLPPPAVQLVVPPTVVGARFCRTAHPGTGSSPSIVPLTGRPETTDPCLEKEKLGPHLPVEHLDRVAEEEVDPVPHHRWLPARRRSHRFVR